MARGGSRAGAGRPLKGSGVRVRLTIYFDPHIAAQIRHLSASRGQSMSDVANGLLAQALNPDKKTEVVFHAD